MEEVEKVEEVERSKCKVKLGRGRASILYFDVDIDASHVDQKTRGVSFSDDPDLIATMPDHEWCSH